MFTRTYVCFLRNSVLPSWSFICILLYYCCCCCYSVLVPKSLHWIMRHLTFWSSAIEDWSLLACDDTSLGKWFLAFPKSVVPPSSASSGPRLLDYWILYIKVLYSFETSGKHSTKNTLSYPRRVLSACIEGFVCFLYASSGSSLDFRRPIDIFKQSFWKPVKFADILRFKHCCPLYVIENAFF
jgi:hypothetical protein